MAKLSSFQNLDRIWQLIPSTFKYQPWPKVAKTLHSSLGWAPSYPASFWMNCYNHRKATKYDCQHAKICFKEIGYYSDRTIGGNKKYSNRKLHQLFGSLVPGFKILLCDRHWNLILTYLAWVRTGWADRSCPGSPVCTCPGEPTSHCW